MRSRKDEVGAPRRINLLAPVWDTIGVPEKIFLCSKIFSDLYDNFMFLIKTPTMTRIRSQSLELLEIHSSYSTLSSLQSTLAA